jgi:hypothetical protein
VGAADDVHEDDRVQRDERRGAAGFESPSCRELADDECEAEHRERGNGLEGPEPGRDVEQAERVAAQREQGAVDARREAPVVDARRRRVGRDVRRDRDIRIQAVLGAEPRVADIAEDVEREQRRGEREGDDRHQDRDTDRAPTERGRARGDHEIGGKGDVEGGEILAASELEAVAVDAEQPVRGFCPRTGD